LSNLLQWLRHVDLAFESRMHSQKGCPIQLLKSRHEHNLNVLHVEHVKVAQVELGLAAIDEQLAIDTLVKVRAV